MEIDPLSLAVVSPYYCMKPYSIILISAGKSIREGQAQATGVRNDDCLDCVITNVVIIDHTGIVKADIGMKGQKIVAIGKGAIPIALGVTNLLFRSRQPGHNGWRI